jgi:hypothetical protein
MLILFHPLQNEIGPDESGSASDEDRIFHDEKYRWGAIHSAPWCADSESEPSIVNKKDGNHPVLNEVRRIV